MKRIKGIIMLTLGLSCMMSFGGCYYDKYNSNTTLGYVTEQNENAAVSEEPVYIPEFDAMFYDNDGNNYVTFRGNKFWITPNKVKQWGYDSNGTWTWWYEMSSVMTVSIDGLYVHGCGSTILFKDTRIEIMPLNTDIGVLDSTGTDMDFQEPAGTAYLDYMALRHWWKDIEEKGQGEDVIIIIQSQNGNNIGVVKGSDIRWEVAEKLPKTTLITIDDELKLYLHRCNFTIIDTDLFDKMVTE